MTEKPSLGMEIVALANSIKRNMLSCSYCGEIPLTSMQIWVLGYIASLYQEQEVFQRDVENAFNITRATASGILKRMERDGLVLRETAASDGRQKKLILTSKALGLCQFLGGTIVSLDAEMAANIDPDDLSTFFRVLAQIKANVNK